MMDMRGIVIIVVMKGQAMKIIKSRDLKGTLSNSGTQKLKDYRDQLVQLLSLPMEPTFMLSPSVRPPLLVQVTI